MICRGCNGVVGRDCWNPQECEWISRDMETRAAAEAAAYYTQASAEYYAEQEAQHLAALASREQEAQP